jgi:PAS domain-containing protein
MKLTIRAKLLFGFLTLMVLLVAGYIVVEYRLDRIKRANEKIREEWTEVNLVNNAQLSIDGNIADLAGYLISGDDAEKERLRASFQKSFEQIKMLEQLQESGEEEILEEELHREKELEWINSFKKDFSEIESVLEELLALQDPRGDDRGKQLFEKLTQRSQIVLEDLNRFRAVAQEELEHSIRVARKEEKLSDRILFFSVTGMVFTGLVLSFFFSQSIARPIINLRNRSVRIGKGDFDYPSVVSSKDEIGDLDRSLQTMALNLKELYENLEELVQERTKELKNANEHLQQLFNGITDGILVVDKEFKVVDANSGLRKLIGLPEDATPQLPCYAACAGSDSICSRCPAVQTFETGQSSSAEMIWQVSGQKLQVEVRTFPLSQNGPSPAMDIEYVKDVSRKLAAVGTLAAGIAHEINNPLSGVAYAVEAATNLLNARIFQASDEQDEISGYLKTIQAEVYRCKAITRGLLDFSRESETDRELCDMNEIVTSTLELLGFKLRRKNVVVQKDLEPKEETSCFQYTE